jgi:GAF domain-containing protein
MPGARRDREQRLGRLVDEQAALRRVATLVARGVSPVEIFNAVGNEVSRVLGCEQAVVERFAADGSELIIVGASEGSSIGSIGDRWELEDFLASTAVHRTGRPARIDLAGARNASGPVADRVREIGFISTVATPIVADGSLWGVITVADTKADLPPDTEARLEHFVELVATAIATAESRADLAGSEAGALDLAREQTALRRVATLVAEGTNARDLFAAVTQEVANLCGIPVVGLHRFESDGTFTMMGIAGETNHNVGDRRPVEDVALAAMILATGRPAHKEYDTAMPGPLGAVLKGEAVGVPILVGGSLWGFIVIAGKPGDHLPGHTEERLARFTELVATAIADSQAREHVAQLAEEQAALRRVATTVARGSPPGQVFAQVAEEVGLLLGVEMTGVHRFEPDGYATVVTNWGEVGEIVPLDRRVRLEGDSVTARVYRTARPARIDSYECASGPVAAGLRKIGMRAGVGSPIVVDGRLWGAIAAVTSRADPLPADSEARIAEFTGLVATAIANVEAWSEVQRLGRGAGGAASRGHPGRPRSQSGRDLLGGQQRSRSAVRLQPGRRRALRARRIRDGRRGRQRGHPRGLDRHTLAARGFPGRHRDPSHRASHEKRAAGLRSRYRPCRRHPSGDKCCLQRFSSDRRRGRPVGRHGRVRHAQATASRCGGAAPEVHRIGGHRNRECRESRRSGRFARGIVAAADESRRRIERDLHDGAQQRLVHAVIVLKIALEALHNGDANAGELVAEGLRQAEQANFELRELAHGILPAALTRGGLRSAVQSLVSRISLPVSVEVSVDHRLPAGVDATAYFIVSEALTNVVKHARANRATVTA